MQLFHVILALITSAHFALLAPTEEQFREFVCKDQACYSIFWDSRRYDRAKRDCEKIQGHLMTVKNSMQAEMIAHFLSNMKKDSFRLWIGLEPKDGCTDLLQPLRGFTWVTGDVFTVDNIHWINDIQNCGTFCVTIHKNGTWEECECKSKADGFLCEVPYAASCNPLELPLEYNVTYVHSSLGMGSSSDTMFIPPNTNAIISMFQSDLICEEKQEGHMGWGSTTPGAWTCLIEQGGCEHDCEEEDGMPECKCPSGLQLLEDNRSCSDLCTPNPCSQMCDLTPTPPGFICTCSPEYELSDDGKTCIDIDECAADPNICEHQCRNTIGSYTCVCKPGFVEAKTNCDNPEECTSKCLDIDECESSICEQDCVNFPGGYMCSCSDGFVIDESNPKKCKRVCTASVCEAECQKNNCKCPDGYILEENEDNKRMCIDVDECEDNPCEWACSNLFGTYECLCPEGYTVHDTECLPPEGWTRQPTQETTKMPTLEPIPLTTNSIDPAIWLGIFIGIISMLTALITMLCRIRRKHYMGELNLEYKIKDTEKDVILQQVKTVPQWRL